MTNSNSITRGGIYTAVSVILVYLSSVLPTSKLTILTAASAIIPLSILTIKVKNTIVVYAATSLLCLVLGLRAAALAYILFFGLYGIVKYYIERLRNLPIEILLKLIFFNISFAAVFLLAKVFFSNIINIKTSIYFIIVALQIVFLIYDYALTIIISYIRKKI